MLISFTLNGKLVEKDVPPHHYCLKILNEEFQCRTMQCRCNTQSCGTCLILLNDKPVLACMLAAFELRSQAVWTIEGLVAEKGFQDIQIGFSEANAWPCAYCAPARVIATEALLRSALLPGEREIQEAEQSVTCSCIPASRVNLAMKLAAKARELRLK